ncbi:MAG: putative mreD [Chlamydiota bacterium]|jgi:rod shape-determining protein MreD
MKHVPLLFSFGIATLFTLFASAFFPSLHLLTFSPFLCLMYHRLDLEKSLWLSAGCGLLLDLLSSDVRFGIQALNLTLTTLVFYKQKRHFFDDKPISLTLFSVLVSLASTLFLWVLLPLSGNKLCISWQLAATDLLILPLCDGVYALCCFCAPLALYAHIAKVGWKSFIKKWIDKWPFKKQESVS